MTTILPPRENTIEYPHIKVFLPYAKVHPATLISLIGYNYTPVYTDPTDDLSHYNYWVNRWKEQETFINIEQDIVPWPGAIESIWECPELVCTYDFNLPIHRKRVLEHEVRLGCIKVSKEFIAQYPNLWEKPARWDLCDMPFLNSGYKVHQHFPNVVNANLGLLGFANIKEDNNG